MSSHKSRITRLEKIRDTQPAKRIDIIEIHKTFDDGREVIEVIDLRTAKPSEILTTTDEQRAAMESIREVTYGA